MVRTLANIGLVLVSVALAFVVALGALEAYLRLADPLGDQINHPGIYRANQVWGYSYLPSQGFRVSHAEFVNDMTTDQLGFRRPLREASEGGSEGPRIVILGDSFMAGFSIPDGQVFSHQLEARLPHARVWNIAVNGWGTNNQRAALRELLPILMPTHVIIAFFENDFFNNIQHVDKYYIVEGHLVDKYCPNTPRMVDPEIVAEVSRRFRAGSINLHRARQIIRGQCSLSAPTPPADRFKAALNDNLLAYAVLVDAIKPVLRSLTAAIPVAREAFGALVNLDQEPSGSGFPELTPREIEATRTELSAIRQICDQAHCRVAVMLIPSKWSLDLPENPFTPAATEIADELGLPVADLTAAVTAAGGTALYWNRDGHLKPRGHEVMAEALLLQPWWRSFLAPSADQVPAAQPAHAP